MLELRFRHWSHLAAGLLARMLHSIFSIVKEQTDFGLLISEFGLGFCNPHSLVRIPQSHRGADRDRTDDLLVANQALSQTELQPRSRLLTRSRVGLSGVEPLTSRLSGVRSNHLSYRPMVLNRCWTW